MKQAKTGRNAKKKPAETLKEKVRRHLTDKNDVITDDDIRNVVVGNPEGEKSFRVPGEEPKPEPGDLIPPAKQTTPWNILSEGYD
jgi:hypothetical protein